MKLWRSRPAVPAAGTAPIPAIPAADAPTADAPAADVSTALVPVGGDGQTGAPPAPPAGEMPFLDHLEELRWHIFKALAGVAVGVVVCFVFADWIINNLLLAQTHKEFFMYRVMRIPAVDVTLQNRTITGQFFAYYGTVFASALVAGSPLIVYQVWRFIEPGLYPNEKKGVRFGAVFATFFFALGITFGYLVLSPLSLQFFANFRISETIVNEFDISRYFSQLITLTLGAGLLFELPVVVFVLARLGLVTEVFLKQSRRYAIVVVLVLAAVITPGTDPLSLFVMSVPLMLLYELSIVLTRFVERGKRKEALRTETAAAAAVAAGTVAIAETPGDVPPVSRPE